MIRRLTSAPKPAALVWLITSSALAVPSSPTRRPATSAFRAAATTGGTGASSEVESHGSCPDITSCSRAASSTVLVSGPGVSRDEAKATTPYLDEPPYVGFTPTRPQTAAGWRIEPPVSVPMPSGAWYAATAAAEPPDDPPGTRLRSHE